MKRSAASGRSRMRALTIAHPDRTRKVPSMTAKREDREAAPPHLKLSTLLVQRLASESTLSRPSTGMNDAFSARSQNHQPPTELVVAPAAAHRDADREEDPRDGRPRACSSVPRRRRDCRLSAPATGTIMATARPT